ISVSLHGRDRTFGAGHMLMSSAYCHFNARTRPGKRKVCWAQILSQARREQAGGERLRSRRGAGTGQRRRPPLSERRLRREFGGRSVQGWRRGESEGPAEGAAARLLPLRP